MRTPSYSHSQAMWALWLALTAAGLAAMSGAIVALPAELPMHWLLFAAAPLVLLLVFGRLRVQVDAQALEWQFGYLGLPRWRLPLADIMAVTATRTGWVDGWGIHYRPGLGWVFNAWGFGAVRIEKRDGRVFRLGTDEPERLASVITARLPRRR
jgi:hypothetical protein